MVAEKIKIAGVAVLILLIVAGTWLSVKPSEHKEEPGYSLTLVDDLGRVVSLSKLPENIISLAPSNTEILFALGLGDKIIGVTTYDDYPPEATQKEKIGGFSTVDVEKVVSLAPDLVLSTAGVQEIFVRQLEELKVTVIALDLKDLNDILQGINLVGRATGTENMANELIENMRKKIDYITSKIENAGKPRVFHVIWHDPLWTAGKGTFVHDLITRAGGTNVAENGGSDYFQYSLEALVQADPEVIILGAHGVTPADMESLAGWTDLKAVRENRVYTIDEDLTSRPGPRIVDGLEQMARYIHPELFG